MLLLVELAGKCQVGTLQSEANVVEQSTKGIGCLDIKAVAVLDVYLLVPELLHECDKVIEVLISRVKIDIELACGVVQLEMILEWNR